jgi:hypothetical protein
MKAITITVGDVVLHCALRETPTAAAIWDACPFTATAQTWGDEVYFPAPAEAIEEPDARDVMQPGEIAFWLQGNCIAIAWGPTPASQGKEIRLASPANVFADADADSVLALDKIKGGAKVAVERAE